MLFILSDVSVLISLLDRLCYLQWIGNHVHLQHRLEINSFIDYLCIRRTKQKVVRKRMPSYSHAFAKKKKGRRTGNVAAPMMAAFLSAE